MFSNPELIRQPACIKVEITPKVGGHGGLAGWRSTGRTRAGVRGFRFGQLQRFVLPILLKYGNGPLRWQETEQFIQAFTDGDDVDSGLLRLVVPNQAPGA